VRWSDWLGALSQFLSEPSVGGWLNWDRKGFDEFRDRYGLRANLGLREMRKIASARVDTETIVMATGHEVFTKISGKNLGHA
jgi:hypothetical protein